MDNIEDENILNLTFNYFESKFLKMSQNSILIFSVLSSGYLSYKYLKNKEVYSEYNGHFNSPRNELNKRLTFFHVQESLVRFGFGVVLIGGMIYFLQGLLKSKKRIKIENNKESNNEKIENVNLTEQIKLPIFIDGKEYSNILSLNEYDMSKEQIYDLSETQRRNKIVESYNQNKK